MAIVIKRYPNRKLYNTDTKRYITLDGIAELIRGGADVEVVDHKSGEDLTSLTLSQIIFEQEKKSSGFLPQSVLAGLIQAGGETLQVVKRTVSTPLELLRQVDDEIERRIKELVTQGELARDEGGRLLEKMIGRRRRDSSETQFDQMVKERGIATREQIESLSRQIDALNAKLDEIETQRAA